MATTCVKSLIPEKITCAQGWLVPAFAAFIPVSITGSQTCLALLLLIAAYRFVKTGRRKWGFMDFALTGFLAWSALTAATSIHPEISLLRLPRLWVHLTWFALMAATLDRRMIVRSCRAISITAALMGVYGLAQHWWGPTAPRVLAPPVRLWQPTGGYFHAVGMYDHHLTFGNMMSLVFCVTLGLVFSSQGRNRLIAAAAAFAIFLGIVFSYARSAWIGLVAGLALFAYLKGRRIFVATAAAGAVVLMLALGVSPSLRERFSSSFNSAQNLERLYIWKTSLAMAADHPFVGIGPGVYRQVVEGYREGYNIRWTTASHAHNSFIMVAAESGWPALALFLALLAAALWGPGARLRHLDASSVDFSLLAALLSGMAGFAFSSFFQHNFGDAEVVTTFWFIVATAAGAARLSTTDQEKRAFT